jgi:hypothetical protein
MRIITAGRGGRVRRGEAHAYGRQRVLGGGVRAGDRLLTPGALKGWRRWRRPSHPPPPDEPDRFLSAPGQKSSPTEKSHTCESGSGPPI